VRGGAFDHARTRFPLAGRHDAVPCASCHAGAQRWRTTGFARCAACHRDPHLAQLASGGRDCASCHRVEGFRPSSFGVAAHARTGYPLLGAHLAVPCDGCHARIAARALPEPFGSSAAARAAPAARLASYHPASADCASCHRDPHAGQLAEYQAGAGCASCHVVEGWATVRFDHGRSRFPLGGRHAAVACASCHRAGAASRAGDLRLSGLPLACEGCHADPHAGQLTVAGAAACASCHDDGGWKPARFDHRQARFPLEGAHARVPCAGCHQPRTVAGKQVVTYRPLPTACVDCHAGEPVGERP
jgi:hypothetical protein